MLNVIPIFGWLIVFIVSFFISIPFYFLWNHLSPTYFVFLPPAFSDVPFWDVVWFFWLMPMLKILVFPRFSNIPPLNFSKK